MDYYFWLGCVQPPSPQSDARALRPGETLLVFSGTAGGVGHSYQGVVQVWPGVGGGLGNQHPISVKRRVVD